MGQYGIKIHLRKYLARFGLNQIVIPTKLSDHIESVIHAAKIMGVEYNGVRLANSLDDVEHIEPTVERNANGCVRRRTRFGAR